MDLGSIFTSSARGSCTRLAIEAALLCPTSKLGNSSVASLLAEYKLLQISFRYATNHETTCFDYNSSYIRLRSSVVSNRSLYRKLQYPRSEIPVSRLGNSSISPRKRQCPALGTPVPSLETVISSADTHYSCKHKDYRPTLGVADKVSATHLQQVSATL